MNIEQIRHLISQAISLAENVLDQEEEDSELAKLAERLVEDCYSWLAASAHLT